MGKNWQIPDLTLIDKIGEGGFGEVWIAKDLLGHYQAAKIIPTDLEHGNRFSKKEWKGLENYQQISREYPELLTIFRIGEGERFIYYLMEIADPAAPGWQSSSTPYLPKTLSQLLSGSVPLDSEQCLTIALQVTQGLIRFHENGLIHRDIKPSNIIFVGGQAKLADIGLVRSMGDDISYAGTELYIAPEGPKSAKSDFYSLGKVFYQMLTGNSVDQFPSLPGEAMNAESRTWVLEFNTIVSKCTHPDPACRYSHGSELLSDLEHLQAGSSVRKRDQVRSLLKKTASATLAIIALFILWQTALSTQRDIDTKEELVLRTIFEENFDNPSLNSELWEAVQPFDTSSISQTNGLLNLKSRGQILTKEIYGPDLEISGKLVLNHTNEVITIVIRSDGSYSDPRYAELNGVKIQIFGKGQMNIDGQAATFPLPLGSPFQFTLRDFRNNIQLFIDNLAKPLIQLETSIRSGGKIGIYNRELDYLEAGIDQIQLSEIMNDGKAPPSIKHLNSLSDDFDAQKIDTTLWAQFLPWTDSRISLHSGRLRLENTGTLVTKHQLKLPITIEGRFRFLGNPTDTFRVAWRFNDFEKDRSEFKYVAVQFQIVGVTQKLGEANLSFTGPSKIASLGSHPIELGKWVKFTIQDDGRIIRLFMGDRKPPTIMANTTLHFGNRIAVFNREGEGAGSFISAGSVVEIDYLNATHTPNKTSRQSL